MTLVNRTFSGLNPLADLLNEFIGDENQVLNPTATVPAVNIKEREKDFTIELAVPGINKEDIDIDLDKNILTISSQVKKEKEEKNEEFSMKEFSYTNFKRSFSLPETVDAQNIKAEYTDGILTLTIAKKEETIMPKRKIEIK